MHLTNNPATHVCLCKAENQPGRSLLWLADAIISRRSVQQIFNYHFSLAYLSGLDIRRCCLNLNFAITEISDITIVVFSHVYNGFNIPLPAPLLFSAFRQEFERFPFSSFSGREVGLVTDSDN